MKENSLVSNVTTETKTNANLLESSASALNDEESSIRLDDDVLNEDKVGEGEEFWNYML